MGRVILPIIVFNVIQVIYLIVQDNVLIAVLMIVLIVKVIMFVQIAKIHQFHQLMEIYVCIAM